MTNYQSSELFAQISKFPAIDIHTHLNAAHLGARGLHDILLYHMLISDLYSAGYADGSRLSENPDEKEVTARIEKALPFLALIQNTSCFWMCRNILSELYGWHEPITSSNWRKLDELIRTKSSDPAWPLQVLAKAGINRAGTELALRADGKFDDVLFYAIEWAFFARTQWGIFDAPLFELEYAWSQDKVSSPLPVSLKQRPSIRRPIKTVTDIKEAMAHYYRIIPKDMIRSTAQHVSTDIQYQAASDAQMQAALDKRSSAGPLERDIYASYLLGSFLMELEKDPQPIVFQFSFGAEPLPFETASRLNQDSIAQLAEIVARHPKIKFQCFLSSRHANQSLCTLCRELPNLSLAGYWWHNFFPSIITQIMDERLDMLSVNKQIGFFSDAYCVEWLWAKSKLVRLILADVLQKRINNQQYSVEMALQISSNILLDTPSALLNLK